MSSLIDDAPLPDPADLLARGVARLLQAHGYATLTEFTLRSGRRADVAAVNRKGKIAIVEIKRSVQDFRTDVKWPDYLDYCDLFYFAVPAGFPSDILPEECGLILADRFYAEIVRPAEPPPASLHASRRREVVLRFAMTAAGRLQQLADPEP